MAMNARTAGLIAVAVAIAAWLWMNGSLPEPGTPRGSVAEEAQRVVCLDPGITEVVLRLAAADTLVARPDHTDEWPELAQLPTVGTGLAPNYEGIVRARPDLIIASGTRGAVLADLQSIAPTMSLPWLGVSDVAGGIRRIGAALGRTEAGEQLARQVEDGLQPKLSEQSPRVLLLISAPSEASPDLWYIKDESLHGAALRAAGGRNAVAAATSGTPSLAIERLLEVDPDVILVMIADNGASDEALARHRQFWDRFTMLSAVKSDRIDFLVGGQHFYTGPGILDLVEKIEAKLAVASETKP